MKRALAALLTTSAILLAVSSGLAQGSSLPPDEQGRLNQCIIGGDSHCIVRLLGGRTGLTLTEARALFSAQREIGDRAGTCRTARTLIAMDIPAAQRAMIEQYVATRCE